MISKLTSDIVSTIVEDKPLIYISEEAIYLKRDNDRLKEEIERLNNIINEIEKHLQNEISNGRSEDNVWLMGCYDEDREILDKLHELKGSNDNE